MTAIPAAASGLVMSMYVQPNTNAMRVAVTMIGRPMGMTRRVRIRQSDAPSTRAASKTSAGSDLKYCRIRKMVYGTPSVYGRKMAQ